MALVLPTEIHESTFGHMLLVYRKTLLLYNLMVDSNVLVLPVVHKQFLHLLVVTTFVSLVVLDILTTLQSIPIVCGMVSSVEQSREGVVELLVYHGSTRHYPLPPVTTLN